MQAVQAAFRLYASGNESTRTVTIKLNEASYTWPKPDGTRMPFHKDGVVELLQNPVYIGKITAAGATVEDAHEALIDRATWDAVQAIRSTRAAKSPMGGRTSVEPVQRQQAMLIDLAYCSNCGARLWYLSTPRRYYRCSGRATGSHCNGQWCPAKATEQRVLEAISILSLPKDWQNQALLRAQTFVEQTQPGQIDRPALEARLKRLGRLYQDGLISDEQYERDRDSLREQLSAAPVSLPVTDMRAVASLLGDLPAIVKTCGEMSRGNL